ncbi:hypothetical protein E2320_017316 [Naja naja]|nr:hypothetical protein E2320_017316 [Naja naja]
MWLPFATFCQAKSKGSQVHLTTVTHHNCSDSFKNWQKKIIKWDKAHLTPALLSNRNVGFHCGCKLKIICNIIYSLGMHTSFFKATAIN